MKYSAAVALCFLLSLSILGRIVALDEGLSVLVSSNTADVSQLPVSIYCEQVTPLLFPTL
jgi:hypothetical protein